MGLLAPLGVHACGPGRGAAPVPRTGHDTTALDVTIEPAGFACVTEGLVPRESSIPMRPAGPTAMRRVYSVVTPLTLRLRSADGRLHADLPGDAEATVYPGESWNGIVEAASGLVPVARLAATGQHAGFRAPEGTMAFLSVWLNAPLDGNLPSQLLLQVYKRDPGTPAFPDVNEHASNRVSCFGRYSEKDYAEAPIVRAL
jgi:hypothetical protein